MALTSCCPPLQFSGRIRNVDASSAVQRAWRGAIPGASPSSFSSSPVSLLIYLPSEFSLTSSTPLFFSVQLNHTFTEEQILSC